MRDFVKLKEKINSKLTDWKARILSQANQTVLIKSDLVCILYLLCIVQKLLTYQKRLILLAEIFIGKHNVVYDH